LPASAAPFAGLVRSPWKGALGAGIPILSKPFSLESLSDVLLELLEENRSVVSRGAYPN
jgi:hypothetical protein